MKRLTKRFLALKVALIMALAMSAIPAFAGESAYLGAENCLMSLTDYTREEFLADFEAAQNKAFMGFEDGTYTDAAVKYLGGDLATLYGWGLYGKSVSIANCNDAALNIYHRNTLESSPDNASNGMKTIDSSIAYSGSKSLSIWTGHNNICYLPFGYQVPGGTSADLYTTALTDLRPVKVGFMVSSGTYSASSETITVKMQYSDGTTSTEETVVNAAAMEKGMGSTGYFVGMQVPYGKYIEYVAIKTACGAYIDDICVVMADPTELPDESKTDKIVVTGEEAFEQPAYNAVEKHTYSAVATDIDGNTLNPEIQWRLDGDYYGDNVTIDENGVLTVKRDFKPENTIKVVAYVYDEVKGEPIESEPFEVSVSATEPYLRSDKIGSSSTSYTREAFIADMEKASHVAVLNFENGEEANGKNYVDTAKYANTDAKILPLYRNWQSKGAGVTISGNGGMLNIDCERKLKNGSFEMGYSPSEGVATSGAYGMLLKPNVGDNILYFGSSTLTQGGSDIIAPKEGLKVKALGFTLISSADQMTCNPEVTLSDGTTQVVSGIAPSKDGGKAAFFGIKAPEGKYIVRINPNAGGWVLLDDLCVIMDTYPSLKTTRFNSKNAVITDEINFLSELKDDVNGTGKKTVTATYPEAKGTMIIALYGANGELVAVNSAPGTQVSVDIDVNTAYTKVAAYVWDGFSKIVPVGNPAIVEN